MLLETSEMSVEDICRQVGYNNKANFHKNFNKYMGTTPKKYRTATKFSTVVQVNHNQNLNNYFL